MNEPKIFHYWSITLLISFPKEMGKKIIGVDNETMKVLLVHDWRGGVRELENVIEHAMIFAAKENITTEDLADHVAAEVFGKDILMH